MVDLPQDFIGIGVEPNFAEMLTRLFSQYFIVGATEVVTGSGVVTVGANVSTIFLNKLVAGDTTVQFGPVANRTVGPVQIVDIAGNAGTVTVLPFGAETIMKLPSAVLLSYAQGAGSAASQTFWPSTTINGWYIA